MTTLLVHSREPFLVKGLEAVLRQDEEFDMLPASSNLADLRTEILRSTPDIVLLELSSEVTFAVLSELRQSCMGKIVLWVNTISPDLAFQAMGLGIRGILRKTLSPKLQVQCLQKVRDGELWFEKNLIEGFSGMNRTELTRREGQILRLLSQGLKNREIATHLTVSEGTVKVYLSRLFQKIGAKDRFELALFGLKASAGKSNEVRPEEKEEMTHQACALS
jgi:DNA-binding NarL/FixJ family response regulator